MFIITKTNEKSNKLFEFAKKILFFSNLCVIIREKKEFIDE